jgi:hypothetical protein
LQRRSNDVTCGIQEQRLPYFDYDFQKLIQSKN